MRTALIDGDILKYKAGFSAQKTKWTHKFFPEEFIGKTAAKEWHKETQITDFSDDDWYQEIVLDPWEDCKAYVDGTIEDIMRYSDAESVVVCLSPDTTFRDELAVTRPYKGNRESRRPEYEDKIIQHIKDTYTYSDGDNIEADDVMGMSQTTDTIIASNDKDLDMIPGEHCDFDHALTYMVTPAEADRFFMKQLIMGDSTDNIAGIPRHGKVFAERTLGEFSGDHLGLVEYIKDKYEEYYPGEGEIVMKEMAGLLWILRRGETPDTAGWKKLLGFE